MRSKRAVAAAAAAVMALCSAFTAFAEPWPIEPPDTENGSVTTEAPAQTTEESVPSETEAPSAPETTAAESTQETTAEQTVQTTAAPAPSQETAPQQTTVQTTAAGVTTPATTTTTNKIIKPAKVYLSIGEIKDEEFDVTLNVDPDQLISSAVIKVEYDNSLMELTGSLINSAEIGGQPAEENKDGAYTFTYINTAGTSFSGVYSTLHFRITDKKMTSSVIYVSVDKLEDTDLLDVPNNIQNGIVKYQDEAPAEESSAAESEKEDDSSKELPVLNVKLGSLPMMLNELDIPDTKNVKSVKILDTKLAKYEESALSLLAAGETEMIVKYNSGKELRFRLVIAEADVTSSAAESAGVPETTEDTSGRTFMIAMAILAAVAAVAIEYIVIMKPFDKNKTAADDGGDGEETEFVEYDEDDDTEMVQDPEEVFARKKKPADKTDRHDKNRNKDK